MPIIGAVQIELATVVKQSNKQVSCNLNGEIAILNLTSTCYFGLEQVGAFIWEAMDEPRKVSELCKRVFEHFDVEEDRCQADVIEFIGRLNEAGLVEFVT